METGDDASINDHQMDAVPEPPDVHPGLPHAHADIAPSNEPTDISPKDVDIIDNTDVHSETSHCVRCNHQVHSTRLTCSLLILVKGLETTLVALLSSRQVIENLARAIHSVSIGNDRPVQSSGGYDADDESQVDVKRKSRKKSALENEIHVSFSFIVMLL
jgi:hypothetical protein